MAWFVSAQQAGQAILRMAMRIVGRIEQGSVIGGAGGPMRMYLGLTPTGFMVNGEF